MTPPERPVPEPSRPNAPPRTRRAVDPHAQAESRPGPARTASGSGVLLEEPVDGVLLLARLAGLELGVGDSHLATRLELHEAPLPLLGGHLGGPRDLHPRTRGRRLGRGLLH